MINAFKSTLDQHRPLDPAIVANLQEDLIVRRTYHTNAIEGNTLTLRKSKVALEGIAIGDWRCGTIWTRSTTAMRSCCWKNSCRRTSHWTSGRASPSTTSPSSANYAASLSRKSAA